MTELRAGIDALDAELVQGLALRARFIDRAAALKAEIDWPARIDARVEEVVQNVRRHAETAQLSPELIETLWRQLIDWSIAREEVRLGPDELRKR